MRPPRLRLVLILAVVAVLLYAAAQARVLAQPIQTAQASDAPDRDLPDGDLPDQDLPSGDDL